MIQAISNLIRQIGPQIQHNTNVTDNLFNFIENNQIFLVQYQNLCNAYGRQSVNRWTGELVKQIFNLSNIGTSPASSKLIKTYTLH